MLRYWWPNWSAPWVFWGALAALAILFFLYLWWRRSRRRTVPALFLWEDPDRQREDGRQRELRRLPLSFWLEALAILLIFAAAAAPWWPRQLSEPPLTLVLDNSASMLAGPAGATSLAKARAEAERRIAAYPGRRVRLLLVGADTRLLSDSEEQEELLAALIQWKGGEAEARLTEAVMAEEVRFKNHEIAVLTDLPRPEGMPDEIGWWSEGRPLDNVGIIQARRSAGDGNTRVVLLIGNYTRDGVSPEITLRYGDRSRTMPLTGRISQAQLELPPGDGPVSLSVAWDGDAFPLDDEILLLSEKPAPLAVAFAAFSDALRAPFDAVLDGNPEYRIAPSAEAELFICSPSFAPRPAHRLIVHSGGKDDRAQLVPPPYTIDRTHPLADGLSLDGVLWNASAGRSLPGRTVISGAGGIPLLSVSRRPGGWYDIHLNWRGDGGNLARHPAWPILFWNLRSWLSSERPGPEKINYASGERLVVNGLRDALEPVRLTLPDGGVENLSAYGMKAFYPDLGLGTYRLDIGERSWPLAVNFLSSGESDLTRLGPADYRPSAEKIIFDRGMRKGAWAALALAMAVLFIHQFIYGKRRKRP